jgi:glyoxylase-like metal-dependent hydrolase (beta-lactamase superfamily II)
MKIGPYELHAVETGMFRLDGGSMFGVVPWAFWSKTNPPDELQRIQLAARCLLIRGEGRNILIDDGNGTKWSEKLTNIYKFDNSQFDLLSSLKKLGLKREDITDVILTHLHFDHAGGSTMMVDGKLEVTFPNARFYLQKKHWEQSQHPTEKDRASFFYDDFTLLFEKKLVELVDGDVMLFPGIEVRVMNGHTEGLQLPKISDGRTTLLFCSDLLPLAVHVPYPYIMGYDIRPLETLADKKRILPQAFEEKWILFLEHDPQVQAMTIKKAAKGFEADTFLRID